MRSRNVWHGGLPGAFFARMDNHQQQGDDERIVAVGLLTRREVTELGAHLSRLYPIKDDSKFADLLDAIDEADRDYHRHANAGRS